MTDHVLDPEKAMKRDTDKKKLIATRTSEIVRNAFIKAYKKDFKVLPDLTNPMINMFFNCWLAAQGKQEWLSPEEVQELKRKQIQNERRSKTMLERRSQRGER